MLGLFKRPPHLLGRDPLWSISTLANFYLGLVTLVSLAKVYLPLSTSVGATFHLFGGPFSTSIWGGSLSTYAWGATFPPLCLGGHLFPLCLESQLFPLLKAVPPFNFLLGGHF